jgi:hypothetical protein
MDRFDIQLVVAKIIFSVSEHLACCLYLCEWRVHIARYNGCVVDQVQETTSVLG